MPMTIVAVPTDARTARACLAAAAAAAQAEATSRITVLCVQVDPASLILPTEEVLTPRRRGELETAARRRVRAIRAVFDAWEPTAGVPAAWDEVIGTVQAEVVSHGRAADLVVLARTPSNEGHDALHAAIFETGRLLLYAPSAKAGRFGQHAAIAWKEDAQAKTAVAAALPWLKRAARVSVVAVGAGAPPERPRTLMAMLARNGVKAEPVLVSSGGGQVGARLLEQVAAIGADCLVMGAYHHRELMQRLLGGVTRHVLQAAELPVFLHHGR